MEGGRVLILDDEYAIGKLFINMFSKLGIEVDYVETGESAIEAYESRLKAGRPFNLCILDLHPKKGPLGSEVMHRLKQLDPGVLGILCTGDLNHPHVKNFEVFGFSGILPKPFSFPQLRQTCIDSYASRFDDYEERWKSLTIHGNTPE